MNEIYVAPASDFDESSRRALVVNGREVVVFRFRERFYAIESECLHAGGPLGEGILLGKVEAVLGPDQTVVGERFSEDEIHIVCPWHGWEYDIETGACAGDRRRRLRTYQAVEKEGAVYVLA